MKQKKVSIVITVLNEEESILSLLTSLERQTVRATEIIICDAGSRDRTQLIITQFAQAHPKLKLRLIEKKGNRSIGRNEAIRHASSPLIAITDAGCIPHMNWLEELLKSTTEEKLFVVAGYYEGKPTTPFEEAVVPYVLVMPDRVNKTKFLPATRSMLLTKAVWEKLGGFNENAMEGEDYAFAHQVLHAHIPIYFAHKAKVSWLPRKTLQAFFMMLFKYAKGDTFLGMWRMKVWMLFARYIMGGAMLLWIWMAFSPYLSIFVGSSFFILYLAWAVSKNKRYAPTGWYWLPVLQVTADIAVSIGSLAGVFQRLTPDST